MNMKMGMSNTDILMAMDMAVEPYYALLLIIKRL